MKNRERLEKMDNQELAEFICDHVTDCDFCKGTDMCNKDDGHANGLRKWLCAEENSGGEE